MELWDAQERRFSGTGVVIDKPKLLLPEGDTNHFCYPYCAPVLRLRVAEKNGVILGFKYQEAVPETCIVTGDKEVMESLGEELTADAHWLKSKGFRSGWGLIPKKFVNAFARFLRKYPHVRPWRDLTPVGIMFSELGD